MIAAVSAPKLPTRVSEIFPITIPQPNLICFRLTPRLQEGNRKLGNRLSYHLSRQFPNVTVGWHQDSFYALGRPNVSLPTASEWRGALERVRLEVKDLSDRPWGIQWVHQAEVSPAVIAQLACQVLQTDCRFTKVPVLVSGQAAQQVTIQREVEFWSETIALKDTLTSAIALSVGSNILFKGNLADFFDNHPQRQNPNQVLLNLHIQENELPRCKQRGIRIKKEPVVHLGAISNTLCLDFSHTGQSSPHPHACRLY